MSKKLTIMSMAAISGLYLMAERTEAAAIVTLTDDGINTTITGTGNFDSTGLTSHFTISGNAFSGPGASYNTLIGNTTDISFLDGNPASDVETFLVDTDDFKATLGWTDPNGLIRGSVRLGSGGAFLNSNFGTSGGLVGYSGDFTFRYAGTLADHGFTAGQTLRYTNPNNGDTITLNTVSAVPEPSSSLMALGGAGFFLMRRRRKNFK